MKLFIDRVMQKKSGIGIVVRNNSHCMEMKKHMGWDKVMRGLAKAQTPATGSNKRRSMRIFPSKLTEQQNRLEAASGDQKFTNNPVLQASNAKHANQMRARQRATGEPRESREDLFKSSQLRLKPFHHSLVTQNYELLAKQIRMTETSYLKHRKAAMKNTQSNHKSNASSQFKHEDAASSVAGDVCDLNLHQQNSYAK